MKELIDQNQEKNGDTIGGVVEVLVGGVPAGLGSYVQWDRKLDAKNCASCCKHQCFLKVLSLALDLKWRNALVVK